ncbi:MAG: ZIP family metal transporter [Patescibacteria group bacterium]
MLLPLLIATGCISLLSLSGTLLLLLKKDLLERLTIFLVAFAAGALLGAAFLHLLPEAIEQIGGTHQFLLVLIGFGIFFFIENILHWHHSHKGQTKHASLGVLSLVGDSLHNFLDGVIIAAAFLVDVKLGFVTSAAVALHEIPQEISEFAVLLYAGFSKKRALLLNFFSATSIIAGGVVSYLLGGLIGEWIALFLLFAVGTFLYVGASDFVPEIRREESLKKSLQILSIFGGGIAFMWLLTFVE